ncbi:hypothetical protein EOPP23_18065 [Endozoicomonas sp. OPT23]|uniref:hypothetical protein n=1 Tax=Endozoicomonas sp. OPT23 TaxID=2072845 RepID=UPI00129A1955|nr:hypothetical protein [Endozoicomonas sp. OPT23]MRI34887.1 hypothetical protein [Endozoicomonas sp. OPT23]
MDTEDISLESIENSKNTIAQAEKMMMLMAGLRGKLNIKEGAGRRYLQRVKPDAASLHQVEQEMEQYTDKSTSSPKSSKKRSALTGAVLRHGKA